MKIKAITGISNIPCSAMCIIEENQLNSELKDVENPQHTDWEPKRKDDEALRSEIRNILYQLKKQIIDFVIEVLSSSETEELDIEGAGDFLPESDAMNNDTVGGEQEDVVVKDKTIIVKKIQNKKYAKNPVIETDTLDGLVPDIGDHQDEGDDSPIPTGHNNGGHGEPHETDNLQGSTEEGDKDIIKRVPLTDMRKVFFVSNKESGEYVAIIDSVYEENDCEIEVKYFDDAGNQYNAEIVECSVNGVKTEIEDGKAVKFKICQGKTKAIIKTNLRDYYRCEVKLYANR